MNLENHDYEQALLGAILKDNRVLEEYKLSSSLFDNENCRRVFEQIQRARASGAVADLVTVGTALPGLAAYVTILTSNCGSVANIGHYIEELRELSQRRGIATMSRVLADMAVNAEDVGNIFAYADKMSLQIQDCGDVGYAPLSDALPGAVKALEAAFKARGTLTGIDTGFPELNEKTNGWQKQEMIVIGARPGAGKTSIALNMASAAVRSGKAVGFFSAEMSTQSLIKRLIADWGSVEFKRLNTGLMGGSDFQSIMDAARKLADASFLVNDQPCISLRDLISDARRMKRREHVDIIFVDYLSLIGNEKNNLRRYEQVAEISKAFKQLARELDIPVIALSQLTRDAQGERPNMAQLRDSGAVEQDADIIMLLYNQGWTDDNRTHMKITLIVEKGRNIGTGDIPMIFQPSRMRFGETDTPW